MNKPNETTENTSGSKILAYLKHAYPAFIVLAFAIFCAVFAVVNYAPTK